MYSLFGITLGSDISELNNPYMLNYYEQLYQVKNPPVPCNLILTYKVYITPKTRKIYRIIGEVNREKLPKDRCKYYLHKIANTIETKYDLKPEIELSNALIFENDKVRIVLSCMFFEYTDKQLEKTARLEFEELEQERAESIDINPDAF